MALYKNKKEQEVIKERDLLYSLVENKDAKDFIFVKSKSRLVKLNNKDIYYIEALKDYVVINTLDTRYTIHSTMKEIEKKMGNDQFVRVHRSFIVRMDKIAAIEYPNLQLEEIKKLIPIGGLYRDELNDRIKTV
jgi:DNA-binding LytR/AlgR family response regulator